MIANLGEQTRAVMNGAGVKDSEVEYVVYYCLDRDQYCRCSFADYIEMANEVNFEQIDPLMQSRKMIHTHIEIVARTWWLYRSELTDDEDDWIFSRLPKSKDECIHTFEEIDTIHLIEEDDLIDPNYMEFISDR